MHAKCLLLALGAAFAFHSLTIVAEPEPASEGTTMDYQKVAEKTLFNGEKLQEFRLKNGFRVLFLPRHQAKVLTYQVWFRVGSVDEKLDPKLKKTGLAHLFEHMMFRGSEKYPDNKFDEITARLGGERQNATTYYYRTNYFESIPSRHLETLMELESDRMRALKLSADLLQKEKGAVVGEYRLHKDRPTSLAYDELMLQAFEVEPYRWSVLGSEEEIKGFTLEEAQYFYKTYYAPNNATLIIIGDTTEKELMNLTLKYYGDMPSQKVPEAVSPVEPPQKKERRLEKTHPQATSETLLVAYHTPDVMSEEAVAFSLLGAHLSVGMEARLRKALVDKGIAVRASGAPSFRPNLFQFFVQLNESHKAEEALKIIDRELATLRSTAIPKAELDRSRNQELLSTYGEILDNSSLGNFLGENLMMCGDYMRGFEILEGYKSIKASDLQKAAKKYLVKENRTVVIMRPQKGSSKESQQKGKS